MRNQRRAYGLALLAVLAWSTVATAFKLSLRHFDSWQLLFYANVSSALILAIILYARGDIRRVFTGTPAEYRRSVALGFLNPFLYYSVLFKAYDLLPAQEAQPLNYTWALTLPILSVPLLGHSLGVRDIVALVVGYLGVLVIATRGQVLAFRLSDPFGVSLALGSAIVWALFWIYSARDDRDPVLCLFLSFASSLPLTAVACMVFSRIPLPAWPESLGPLYIGAFEMSITFVLWLSAVRASENTARLSTLIFISPFLSLVFIHLLVGETILPSTLVGLCLIVLGLLIQKLRIKV